MVDFEAGQHVLCIDDEWVESLIKIGTVYTVKRIQISKKLSFKLELLEEDVCLVLEEVENLSLHSRQEIGFNHRRFKPLPKLKIENFMKVTEKVDA
jgi:hypothetical protein